jgi:acyl-coenzyme A synthetase/AMP-(fatty) acid ligase
MPPDVGAALAEHVRARPERVYVESVEQAAGLTFGELEAAANRLAHFLRDRNVKPGDRVSVLADNSLELVVLFFGLQRCGAAVNPINVEVSANNVGQILHDVAPRLVLWSRAIPVALQAVIADADLPALAFGEQNVTPGPELLAMLAPFPSTPLDAPAPDTAAIAIINYTSGSTARPKGVCVSHEAYSHTCHAMAERLVLDPADRLLECRALSWASPQTLTLGPTLHAGATLVLARKFSRSHFFEWIRRYEITIAAGVPAVINMLCERPEPVTAADVPSLRFVTSSSAPLAPERQLEFERRYRIPIVQGAGMTEVTGFMAMNPPAVPRLGSIGPTMPYVRARFVDEAGAVCEPGREGELVVGGPCMASAYLTERGTLVPIPRDGFPTGDLGYMDRDGYIYITGRKKDLIIRGGVNIAPMEITSALVAHPSVAEAATIGVPDAVYGEAIVSFVVARPGERVSAVELLAHCRARLSAFKVPREILLLDAIPTNDRGKLARDALVAIWRRSAAAVPGGERP